MKSNDINILHDLVKVKPLKINGITIRCLDYTEDYKNEYKVIVECVNLETKLRLRFTKDQILRALRERNGDV